MDVASRKRARAVGGGGDSSAGDRLSDLPDALLHAILSCLKARQVVQTRVLAKRWRHLWRSVPCLDIDQREFAENEREKFEDFADNLLSRRNGSLLDTFQLHISAEFGKKHIDASRWIRRGLKCSPKELHFYGRVCYVAAQCLTWILMLAASESCKSTVYNCVTVSQGKLVLYAPFWKYWSLNDAVLIFTKLPFRR